MSVYVGVDGGGTGTTLCVVDSSGRVVSTADSGPTNWNGVGKPTARNNLVQGIQRLKLKQPVHTVCLSMAGVHTQTDIEQYTAWAHQIKELHGARLIVCNDVWAALASGTHGLVEGVVCIAGTGMNCYARHPVSKKEAHAGGMGPWLGDVGSGFYLGDSVLCACSRQNDGRETRSTALLETVMNNFGWKTWEEAIHFRYTQVGQKQSDIAALAPILFQLAEKGDVVALELREQAAQGIALSISTVINKLWTKAAEKVDLVLAGSVWKNVGYRNRVIEIVRGAVGDTGVNVRVPEVDPVMGAAFIALRGIESAKMIFCKPEKESSPAGSRFSGKPSFKVLGAITAAAIGFAVVASMWRDYATRSSSKST